MALVDNITTTMTDYKQLCAELVDDLELADWPSKLKEAFRADIERARAALAEPEPEVEPTLREEFTMILNEARCNSPGRVIGNIELGRRLVAAVERFKRAQPEPEGPDAGEVMQLADNYFSFRGNSHRDQFFATSMEARKDPTQSLQDFARAVLARWGRPS